MNANKARGTRWESAVRDFLNAHTGMYLPDWQERRTAGQSPFRDPVNPWNVRRAVQEGRRDVGDVHAYPFVIQCKDTLSLSVPKWLRQAEGQAEAAGFPMSVVAWKTRNRPVGMGQVFLSGGVGLALGSELTADTRPMYGRYSSITLLGFARILDEIRRESP